MKNRGNFSRFLLLWAGELVSSIGGGLTSFGLGVYIFRMTGGAASMALVTLLGFLPTLVLSVPAGVLAGWLFAIKTGSIWPGLPHYCVVPWRVLAEGTFGALVFVLLVAVPTSMFLVGRAIRGGAAR